MSTHPPLSDMQMAAVEHGSAAPDLGSDTELVDRAMAGVQELAELKHDRMGTPRISGYLDRDAPASVGGFMAVVELERGWYAVRETHGGGSGRWATSREDALAKLRDEVTRSVAYWTELAEMDPTSVVRCRGEHYILGKEPGPNQHRDGLGFGGARWEFIELGTGRHVVSHNLWRQGVIPVEFHPVMPDTHRLAVTYGPDELHAHYVARRWGPRGRSIVQAPLVTPATAEEKAAMTSAWDSLP